MLAHDPASRQWLARSLLPHPFHEIPRRAENPRCFFRASLNLDKGYSRGATWIRPMRTPRVRESRMPKSAGRHVGVSTPSRCGVRPSPAPDGNSPTQTNPPLPSRSSSPDNSSPSQKMRRLVSICPATAPGMPLTEPSTRNARTASVAGRSTAISADPVVQRNEASPRPSVRLKPDSRMCSSSARPSPISTGKETGQRETMARVHSMPAASGWVPEACGDGPATSKCNWRLARSGSKGNNHPRRNPGDQKNRPESNRVRVLQTARRTRFAHPFSKKRHTHFHPVSSAGRARPAGFRRNREARDWDE